MTYWAPIGAMQPSHEAFGVKRVSATRCAGPPETSAHDVEIVFEADGARPVRFRFETVGWESCEHREEANQGVARGEPNRSEPAYQRGDAQQSKNDREGNAR